MLAEKDLRTLLEENGSPEGYLPKIAVDKIINSHLQSIQELKYQSEIYASMLVKWKNRINYYRNSYIIMALIIICSFTG